LPLHSFPFGKERNLPFHPHNPIREKKSPLSLREDEGFLAFFLFLCLRSFSHHNHIPVERDIFFEVFVTSRSRDKMEQRVLFQISFGFFASAIFEVLPSSCECCLRQAVEETPSHSI
jgi:hypothetical protein